MGEIVNIPVGLCGNQISLQFWQTISQEHRINHTSGEYEGDNTHLYLQRINMFYNEVGEGKYVPRSVFVDMESSALDSIRAGPFGALFNPDSFVSGKYGAGNNWAKGHYSEGANLAEHAMDVIRKEAESCDCLQGFQFIHSLGGGTGSGLGTLLMDKIGSEYPDKMMSTYTLWPSPKPDSIVEPYNAGLSVHHLMEYPQSVFCFDNAALLRTLPADKGQDIKDLNKSICSIMSGITSNFRFPGQYSNDYRKLAVNLVLFPRQHFLTVSHSILRAPRDARAGYSIASIPDLVDQVFDPNNVSISCDPRHGRYYTACGLFRGKMSSFQLDELLSNIQNKESASFSKWVPNGVKTFVCDVPPSKVNMDATLIGNTSAIQEVFKSLADQFTNLFRRKAFLHWYTNEGMDEMEFTEAESSINELICEYWEMTGMVDLEDEDF